MRPFIRPMLTFLFLASLSIRARPASAQVRPDLEWFTLRTDHFRVHFTPELLQLARRTAANAERAYEQFAAELAPPRGMIDLVLADNVDFANGYATPFPSNRIVVYARPPVEEMSLRNHVDWNAILVTHELAHVFHLDRTRGWWGVAQRVFGRAAPLFPNTYSPSWLIEGLAVHYETRFAGGGRLAGTEFPMMARAAALGGALPPIDALSQARPHFPGASGAYLYGAFLFDGRDGAGMARFVEAASGRVLPWRHDANARAAFGQGFTERLAAWRDSVSRAGAGAIGGDAAARTLTTHGWTARFPRFLGDDALVYVANDARQVTGAYRVTLGGARTRLGRRNSIDVSSPLAGDGTVQGELDWTDPYSLRSELFGGNGMARRRITVDQRLSQPDVHRESARVLAVETVPGTTNIVVVRPQDDYIRTVVRGSLDLTWSEPRWSPDGRLLAAARWERGGRTAIVVMDTMGRAVRTFAPRGRPLSITSSPAWLPDGARIVFVSDHEGRAMIYLGDVRTGGYVRVWSSATGLNTPDVSSDGRRMAAVELRGDGYHVVMRDLPADVGLAAPVVEAAGPDAPLLTGTPPAPRDSTAPVEDYSPWRQLAPRWWLPIVEESDARSWRYGGYSSGSDVLGIHRWSASYARDFEYRENFVGGAYAYAGFGNPVLTLSVEQDQLHAQISQGGTEIGILAQRTRNAALSALYTRPRVRLSSYAMLGVDVDWVDYRSFPSDTLRFFLGNETYIRTTTYPTVTGVVGVSTMQRPGLAVSAQDGVAAALTMRMRYHSGVQFEDVQETIVSATAAKSIPLPGFARHVIAVRGAYGRTLHETTTAFTAGGNSGSSLELIPGFSVGDSPRTFFARGFAASTQLGVRAAAGSAEYRAPLGLIGRGVKLLPVFLQKASLTGFVDGAAAWCDRAVEFSFICTDSLPQRDWLMSYGGELALDAALQYDVLYRFRAGVARPFRGREFAQRSTTFYLSLGAAF
jgi:WD40-like Beta Propeller Repeat